MTPYLHTRFFYTLLLSIFWALPNCFAQFVSVKGTIADKAGEPLPFVNVQLKGSIVVAVSDINGVYSINLSALDGILIVTCVGFQTQEIDIKGRNLIDVKMQDSYTQLNDVVVVGYGTQKKSVITGAISSVTNKDFKDQPVVNLASSIAGKLAGINVTSPSGTPGAGLLVSIRGAQNPLYVVDGIPLLSESNSSLSTSYDTEGVEQGSGQNISSIADINPNDIESIEILKDASAAAIYGTRAANGVVLITTKRGAQGKTQFNVNYYTGIQKVSRPIEFLSSSEMVGLIENARQNDLKRYQADNTVFGADFNPALLTTPLPANWKANTNTNWLDAVLRTAPVSNIEVSSRGGNDKTRFFIGGGYFSQEGVVIESAYKRMNARINLDHKVNDHFSIGNSLSLTHSVNHRSFNDDTYTGIITNALGASPLMPVYDTNGDYSKYENYEASWLSDNPVKSAKEIQAYTNSDRVLGSAFGEYKFSPNFRFKSTWSMDYTNLSDDQYFSPLTSDAQTVGGRAIYGSYKNINWLGENAFTYQKTIGYDHNLSANLIYSVQQSQTDKTRILGQGFPLGSGLKKIGSASSVVDVKTPGSIWGIMSGIARLNYDFRGKFIAAASFRADASSRFSKDNRVAYFPSVSLGYRLISNADSLRNGGTLTDLKLRASYGVTGDQEIGDFQNISFYKPARYNGVAGLAPRNLADPTLGWQENRMFNIGLDYEFWEGRLTGSLELFKGDKTGLLAEVPLAGTTGFKTITRNGGRIENKGIEFSALGVIINRPGFRWSTSFNITSIKNTVKETPVDNQILSAYADVPGTHLYKVGFPVGAFWGIKYTGVDAQTGAPLFEDLNKDGTIDANDAQYIGKPTPTFFGGFNNTFTIKRFDFNFVTQYSYGNKVYNIIRHTYDNLGYLGGYNDNYELTQIYANNSVYVKDRWMKPGDKNVTYPRASLLGFEIPEESSFWVENASYWRIKTIALGYTIKPQNGKFESMRIYVQAQNPYVLTKYKGFDPEVSSNGGSNDKTAGVDFAAYPQAKTYTIGVNVTF